MGIYALDGEAPELPADGLYWVAETAAVIGRVRLHSDVSIWWGSVLRGAKIGANSLVGAGALITEGKEFPENSVIVGAPAKLVREADYITRAMTARAADVYVRRWKLYAAG